jgi:hypothetical protein
VKVKPSRVLSAVGTHALHRRRDAVIATIAVVLSMQALSGCTTVSDSAPDCRANQRLALVAQSVPPAAYVPCVSRLPTGWRTSNLRVESGKTSFDLESDRSDRAVNVNLRASCHLGDAVATAPRADGARTYIDLRSISPRYAGTLYDVFPGGCVTYQFDFARGIHIALMEEFQNALALFSRRELRVELQHRLGVTLR